jgi:hypothetical protein
MNFCLFLLWQANGDNSGDSGMSNGHNRAAETR